MPRPKTDLFWVHKVREIVENEPRRSAKSIELQLEHHAANMPEPRQDWPRDRTIRDIRKKHLDATPAERRQYAYFHWPETMLAEKVVASGEQSEAGDETWRQATAEVDKCFGHEPCKTQPICESKCPYDLPIRQLMLKLSGVRPSTMAT